MVKHDDKWGTVCDDAFGSTEAEVACKTLGFSGGSATGSQRTGFSESTVPIWIDNGLDCNINQTNFLECHQDRWGDENCNHGEDILLTCT